MKTEFSQRMIKKAKQICKNFGIPYFKINSSVGKDIFKALELDGESGFGSGITYHDDDNTFIGYNDSEPIHNQAITLFHELGHALLNTWDKYDQTPIHAMTKDEFFADMFACIMMALGLVQYDTADNSGGSTFNISAEQKEDKKRDTQRTNGKYLNS